MSSETHDQDTARVETEIVLQFCEKAEKYYRRRGTRARFAYQFLNVWLIVLSSALPIMVLAAPPNYKILQAVIAAIIGALGALGSFFRFRENWIKNMNAAEALRIEMIKFKAHTGNDYASHVEDEVRVNKLMAQYEVIAETALNEWRTMVSMAPDTIVKTADKKH